MVDVNQLREFKKQNKKISMVTCYDYWSARILDQSPVGCLLVGDSLSMVVHGFDSTVHATIEMMEMHTAAVSRGTKTKLIISDLPFLSHRKGKKYLMDCADRLMKAGAGALKMETALGQEKEVRYLTESGIPMIGHVGLTPQFVHQFGGYKVQGKGEAAENKLFDHAMELEKAGCSAIVLECIPQPLAKRISEALIIPTIGIGAGPFVDGQVLVLHDLLGFNIDFKPKFVRQFASGNQWMGEAINNYTGSIMDKSFPSADESFL